MKDEASKAVKPKQGIIGDIKYVALADGSWICLEVPEGIELFRIPPNSPELNPSERLWLPLSEAVSNRCFTDIEQMEDVLLTEMQQLSAQKE